MDERRNAVRTTRLPAAGRITARGDGGPIALADVEPVRPMLDAARRTERGDRGFA